MYQENELLERTHHPRGMALAALTIVPPGVTPLFKPSCISRHLQKLTNIEAGHFWRLFKSRYRLRVLLLGTRECPRLKRGLWCLQDTI